MPTDTQAPKNWFDQGGQAYARFRPEYPAELPGFLASLAPTKALAVDVGCGNGQLTARLAPHFDAVVGIDPSEDQLAHAPAQERVRYLCAPAEKLPLPERGASLITAAQAAHWFDLPAFYAEVHRIAADQAVLALVCYGVLRLEPGLQERFNRFYWHEIGPYWPAERKQVDTGYADLLFPFEERTAPAMEIQREWDLGELLGYISTWSAVRGVREAGREQVLQTFSEELTALWGAPSNKRLVSWPLHMRLGTVR